MLFDRCGWSSYVTSVRLAIMKLSRFLQCCIVVSMCVVVLSAGEYESSASASVASGVSQSVVEFSRRVDAAGLTESCAAGGPCKLGDRGPGGGIVFYVSETPFNAPGTKCQTDCLYLEYATTGWLAQKQNPPQRDCRSWEIIQRPFTGVWEDPYCDLLKINAFKGKTGRTIGSGYGNTTKLLAAAGIGSGPAVARNYRGGGKSDWFVPSIDELVILNSTIRKWMDMEEAGHVFEIDPGVTVWGFSDDMWSSTATPRGNFYINSAWTEISEIPATSGGQIRPVRAFGKSKQASDNQKTVNQILPSSGRCVPASVPFVNIKKPWKLENKKCDKIKSASAFKTFAEYHYSVRVSGDLPSTQKTRLLNSHLSAFLASFNVRGGWIKPSTGCGSIDGDVTFFCEFDMNRIDYANKIYQVAKINVEMFGGMACASFNGCRVINIKIKVENGVWE